VFADISPNTPAVDPIVQALMLTDIVVEVTVMALLLGLAVQIHKRHGTLNPDRLTKLSG
jgi:multicomponent Na+:H+ antiporter subunit C